MTSRRVVVVTGGAGGIGRAIAEELGRAGSYVVTVDPVVSVDGSPQQASGEATTAERIVAAGGQAESSPVSVTDSAAVRDLFDRLVVEHGRLDAVVNVAGISRPTGFARGGEQDWTDVISVHLEGYLNVLRAALPIMAAAGSGRILGITSGSGWRSADTGAYGCAKRAVAALTWQLGARAPEGVTVNALSPIAATRMVTAALKASRPASSSSASARTSPTRSSATGGLSLASMPSADELGPIAAHLVDEGVGWCHGQVVFACGSEVAAIGAPHLLEAVRTDAGASLPRVFQAVTTGALIPAEERQATNGGGNARFGSVFDDGDAADDGLDDVTDEVDAEAPAVRCCAIVADSAEVGAAVVEALSARRITTVELSVAADASFDDVARSIAAGDPDAGRFDAVVVARTGPDPSTRSTGTAAGDQAAGDQAGWEQILADHAGLPDALVSDASWARAVADLAAAEDRPIRLVTLIDAVASGGRSRAQAAAQLSRSAAAATKGRVAAFAVSVESSAPGDRRTAGELTAHLLCAPDAPALSGSELVVGDGWAGLRGHPRVLGSIVYGGPELPTWLDESLRGIVGC